MKKILIFTILGLFALLAIVGGVKFAQIKFLIDSGKNQTMPPATVSSYKVEQQEWEQTLPAIGSLEAAKGLVVSADVSGRVAEILFEAGSEVKAGDLLVRQDITNEQAQLRSAQASLSLASSNLTRIKELFDKNVASKSELDNAQSNYQTAVANVDNIKATIEKKSIRAPFDGRLGIRLVNLGQSINVGAAVVSLQATNQMFANFYLPQQQLPLVSKGLTVRLTSDAVPGKTFSGAINAIDPEIDESTRSIKIQALLPNPEGELLPGMFASLEVVLPETLNVLIVPTTAIQYATFGDSVFVIEPADEEGKNPTATQQFVQLGESRGDFVAVTKGLEVGQEVVSAGGFKLRNGNPVNINNDVAPDYQLEPNVVDQ